MEIVKEQTGDLSAVVKIKVGPSDYEPAVEEQVRKMQRKATLPGFRPGKAPAGVIRKMYGKSILAEELNKMLNDKLYQYLNDNKIEILGNPLPKDDQAPADIDSQAEFEFAYDLGLAPQFDLKVDSSLTFDYLKIAVDADLTDKYLSDLRRRFGNFSNPEESTERDILWGDLTELENGTEKEGGIKTTTTIVIELVKDEKVKASLLGLKIGDSVTFNPKTAIDNETEVAAMLRIPKEELANLNSDFTLKISTINRIEKAELNQEFFDKVYGAGTVTGEEEFLVKIKEDVSKAFETDANRHLNKTIQDSLIEKTGMNLPDEFLKRWIMAVNEKPVTAEQIEAEYTSYSKELKWRLIENKIAGDQGLQVTTDEIKAFVRDMIRRQFAQYGQDNLEDAILDKMSENYLKQQEEVRKIVETISSEKVFNWMKEQVSLSEKVVNYDEFVKLMAN